MENENLGRRTDVYICYLRIFATIAVVWHHTCGTLVDNAELFHLTRQQNIFFEAARQSVSWDVPVFYMITGALLLNPLKDISIKRILKYIHRILLVLVIFGIPYAMVMTMMEIHKYVINWEIIKLTLYKIIGNTGIGHFWYLYVLLGLYLVLPLIRLFVKFADSKEIQFLMIALLIIDFVLPLISKLSGVDIAINIPLTYPCLYMLLGYFSCNCLLQLNRYRKPIVSGVVAIFLLSWILNYATSIDTKPLFAYNSPIIAVYAVGVYVLFGTSNWIMSNRLWSIDRLCFSVYIIHVLFIQFCYR